MIFSLEVLQAKFGDCLLLHYGKGSTHQLMVIDGGPSGVYRNFLKPRLLEVKQALSPAAPLPLSMVMVSHMDDDHVNGILAMTDDMLNIQEEDRQVPFEINHFWFNTFDDIIGNIEIPKISAISASARAANLDFIPQIKDADHSIAAVIASTSQGRQLRKNADSLSAEVNGAFSEKRDKARLVRGDKNDSIIEWKGGLQITVLLPNKQRLKEFQEKWDKDLKKAKKEGDESIIIASITDQDKSPFNLASIVCLAEFGRKKILLTGDARTDDIMEGLRLNNLLDSNGTFHVDILKIPHHGSIKNASDEFYKKVTADHYVISADGKFKNPDKAFLDLLARELKKGSLHFTNKEGEDGLGKKMKAFVEALQDDKSSLKVNFREDEKSSFVINLGKALRV